METVMENTDLTMIADYLADYRRAKADAKYYRGELVRVATELGLPQKKAMEMDAYAFLDGYLVANGIQPQWRADAMEEE
jgi:hypothetical protein